MKVGRPKGFKMKEQSKAAISKTMTGKKTSQAVKDKISKGMKRYCAGVVGRKLSQQTKDRISESMKKSWCVRKLNNVSS